METESTRSPGLSVLTTAASRPPVPDVVIEEIQRQRVTMFFAVPTIYIALLGAMQVAEDREAAVITFLVTASGLSFWGISGAFWGLVAGIIANLVFSRIRT